MSRAVRYKRVIPRSGGIYDADTATTHATDNERYTVCGYEINTRKKWGIVGDHWGITCTRCLKKMEENRYGNR